MVSASIVNGPGKWDLMLSFFYSDQVEPRNVQFEIRSHARHRQAFIRVTLRLLTRDFFGAEEEFGFKGRVVMADLPEQPEFPKGSTVEGHLKIRERTGIIKKVE